MKDIRFIAEITGRGKFDVFFVGADPTYDWDVEELAENLKADFLQGDKECMIPLCVIGTYYKDGNSDAIYDLKSFVDGEYNTPAKVIYQFATTAG